MAAMIAMRGTGAEAALAALAGQAGHWSQGLLEFALPQRCPGCGVAADPAHLLCAACRERIARLSVPLCARCLSRERDPVGCAVHAGFEVWPAWIYDERAAAMIQAFKFRERPALARTLAAAIACALPPGRFDLLLAVPLHRARRRERGYDQAGLLADALSLAAGIPRLGDALTRVRSTRPQTRMGAAARRANLRGAFRVDRARRLEGRRVLLVDDVITTGATLDACLEALSKAGARTTAVALAWAQ
jgi:ComF family protein